MISIAITRSAERTAKLQPILQQHGYRLWPLALWQIEPLPSQPLPDAAALIFTSVYAAQYTPPIPATATVFAIGHATAAALQQRGIHSITAPAPYTSEALLQSEELQRCTASVWRIISGEGGRDVLLHRLKERGDCEKIAVYRRLPAQQADFASFWPQQAQMKVIVLTSAEAWQGLLRLSPRPQELLEIPLLAISERVAQQASSCGAKRVIALLASADHSPLSAPTLLSALQRVGNSRIAE